MTHVGDANLLRQAKQNGFADTKLARLWKMTAEEIRQFRKEERILPVYKTVDTCAAEFESSTPYFYSTYALENESIKSEKESVLVLGSGPIRIGQGVEFDYATVHSVKAIQATGYEAIIMNSNPETVSTDFSISDKLYFEPLTFEDVMNVIELEKPKGVIVQFGGQTAINLAEPLSKAGVKILGTQVADLDRAEDVALAALTEHVFPSGHSLASCCGEFILFLLVGTDDTAHRRESQPPFGQKPSIRRFAGFFVKNGCAHPARVLR